MRNLIMAALFAAPAFLGPASAAEQSGFFPFEYRKVELENGFKAYLIKAGAPGQIAYVTVARVGAREEWEPGKSGFAHFFEHIMFRGTEKYPDYDSVTSRIGAARNASTNIDMTQYYLVASADSLEQIIDLESDRFRNLKYSEADFRTEAGAVLGEFSQGRANPYLYLSEKLAATAFEKHTYRHLTIGFEEDVRRMPEGYDYSLSFYRRYYRPENCVLLLAGDVDFARAERLIRTYYGPWKPGYVRPGIQPEPPQEKPKDATAHFPGKTLPILTVAYKGPAWNARDKLAVATEVLGRVAFGPNSEIYRRLVLNQQKLQMLSGDFGLTRDPNLLRITTMPKHPDDLPQVRADIEKTVERFRREPCDVKLLEDTKRAMRYGFLMGLETAQGVAFALRNFALYTGGIEAVEDYYRTLQTISPEDLRSAAQKYLVENGRTTITLLPATEVRQ